MTRPLEQMTLDQVAEEMKVHRSTVKAWISSGKLKRFKAPGKRGTVRVARRDLEEFVARYSKGGARSKP